MLLAAPALLPVEAVEVARLTALARTVTRHTPALSPARAASRDLDALCARLLARGVPAAVVGRAASRSHQWVRDRAARASSPTPAPSPAPALTLTPAPTPAVPVRRTSVLGRVAVGTAHVTEPALDLPGLLLWLGSDPADPRTERCVLVSDAAVRAGLVTMSRSLPLPPPPRPRCAPDPPDPDPDPNPEDPA